MKLSKLIIVVIAFFTFAFFAAPVSNAQFGGIINQTKSKVKNAENKNKPAPKMEMIPAIKQIPLTIRMRGKQTPKI